MDYFRLFWKFSIKKKLVTIDYSLLD